MRYLEEDEYLTIGNNDLFKYSVGDTVSFQQNGQLGCGNIKDRRSAYYNGIASMYYVINDIYTGDVLIEEDCVIQSEMAVLLESLQKTCFGPADYKRNDDF